MCVGLRRGGSTPRLRFNALLNACSQHAPHTAAQLGTLSKTDPDEESTRQKPRLSRARCIAGEAASACVSAYAVHTPRTGADAFRRRRAGNAHGLSVCVRLL